MLKDFLADIQPYLSFFGDYKIVQAIVVIVLFYVVAWVLDRIVIATIQRLAQRTRFDFDDQLIELLHKPVYRTVVLIGLAVAVVVLALPDPVTRILFSVFVTIALMMWSLVAFRLVRITLRKMAADVDRMQALNSQTLPLFENIAVVLIAVLAIYYVFSAWHVDMTAWLASAGIVGIAVGFAAKDSLANLFSGVFILADAPYKIGDFVVLDSGERGEVTHIGIRSTRLLTRDDVEVTIPNAVMGNTKITNESGGPHEKYRVRVQVGVAYGSDIDLVRTVLTEIAEQADAVCIDPEPRVRFRAFGGSSLNFELLCWVEHPILRGSVLDALNCTVYKRFIEEAIEIPYAKQDVYIKELPASPVSAAGFN